MRYPASLPRTVLLRVGIRCGPSLFRIRLPAVGRAVLRVGRSKLVLLPDQPRKFCEWIARLARARLRPTICFVIAIAASSIVIRHYATFFDRAGFDIAIPPATSSSTSQNGVPHRALNPEVIAPCEPAPR